MTDRHAVHLPITLRLSVEAAGILNRRAAAARSDLSAYVSNLLEQTTHAPMTLEAISGDAQQKFDASGMTDDELGELLEKEKHAARRERRII